MKGAEYTDGFLQELKAKNDIVKIIGKYVRLEKKGKNHWGCCPFHHEKTPSFAINEYEQFYHCFGCGESGDVITFLMKYENMTYPEAVRTLAENAGMQVPTLENEEKYVSQKKLKDRCLEILNIAKEFYKETIYKPIAKPAQDYIKKRKLTRRELEDFQLGYSPNSFDIVNLLRKKGFKDEELTASGVCDMSKSGIPYDFVRERLVFPIINAQNDCIGFSGRNLKSDDNVKYKNTATTLLFNKSKAVFGINLLKKLKQEKGLDTIVLVEGQFDVITMHHYGFKNAVACMGTAITRDHLRELKRLAQNMILCLDGDGAGQKASLRSLEVFAQEPDINLKIAVIPNNADPDELLQQYGSEKMQEVLDNALTPMAFKIHYIKQKYNLTKLDEKTKFIKEVLAEISKLSSNTEQEFYLLDIAKIADVSVDILRRDLEKTPPAQPTFAPQPQPQLPAPPQTELDGTTKAIKFVLASFVHKKAFAKYEINLAQYITNPTLCQLFKFLWDKHKSNEDFKISQLYDKFNIETEKIVQDIINFNFAEVVDEENYFQNCLWQIVENELKFRKMNLSKQYKEEIDGSKRNELLGKIVEIDKQLKRKNLGDFIDE